MLFFLNFVYKNFEKYNWIKKKNYKEEFKYMYFVYEFMMFDI